MSKVIIGEDELECTIEEYLVDVEIDGKTLNMKVTVVDGEYEDCIEEETDIWNSLSLEEKQEIRTALEEHYN